MNPVAAFAIAVSSSAVLVACTPQKAPAASPPPSSSIDFYFTGDAAPADMSAEWTARCVTGGEFAEFAAAYAPDPRMSADERRAQAGKFDRDAFVKIATDAWTKANTALPQDSLLVCVDLASAADTFTRDAMGGIAAVTAGKGRITLRIHTDADWQAVLPYTLAHEMHHSYWVGHHFDASKPFTLADYLTFEGRADYFAGALFTHVAPWTKALDAGAYEVAWRKISPELNSTDWEMMQASMFGSQPAGIPMWAGYTIGYRLVSDRMARAPKLDWKAMTAAPAAEFMPPP